MMGKVKQLLHEDLINGSVQTPSHLDREMYEELIKLNKQVNSIKLILEECK